MNVEPQIMMPGWNPAPYEPKGIDVTEAAQTFMADQLTQRGKGAGIRLGVSSAGCGGYTYKVEFVDEFKEDEEHIFKQENGVSVFIDKKSIVLLDGLQVDYIVDLMSSGLQFSNPAAKHCGCGESFSI